MPIKQYNSISELSGKYDVFFVDLWGVIHDGVEAYPGVHKALVDLKAAGKRVIFLSNAPRRSFKAVEGLRKLGVTDDMYESVVTSGEAVFEFLREMGEEKREKGSMEKNNPSPFALRPFPSNFIIIGPDRDSGLLDGTSYIKVDKVRKSKFLLYIK